MIKLPSWFQWPFLTWFWFGDRHLKNWPIWKISMEISSERSRAGTYYILTTNLDTTRSSTTPLNKMYFGFRYPSRTTTDRSWLVASPLRFHAKNVFMCFLCGNLMAQNPIFELWPCTVVARLRYIFLAHCYLLYLQLLM